MKYNIGLAEQKIRVLTGFALIGVGAYYNVKPVAVLGLIPIVTAMVRWCPINAGLNYSSAKQPNKKQG